MARVWSGSSLAWTVINRELLQTLRLNTMILTHWGRHKMADISQMVFSNAFSRMKMLKFRLRFHWNMLPRAQLKYISSGSDDASVPVRWQAIIWTNDCLVLWRIYSSLGFNELTATKVQRLLTHWGRDKADAISQTTFWSAFSWMKTLEFRLKFHWSLFPRVQLIIFQYRFR